MQCLMAQLMKPPPGHCDRLSGRQPGARRADEGVVDAADSRRLQGVMRGPYRHAMLLYFTLGLLLISGCSTQPYRGSAVETAPFLARASVQAEGPLRVSAAVPDAGKRSRLPALIFISRAYSRSG